MSMKIEKAVVEREPLAVDVLEHLEKLEAVIERYRQQSPPDTAAIQSALGPLTALAQELRNEYAKYEARFTPILDRIAAVDLDAVENFHGFPHIRPLPRRARDIKRAIVAAIEDLDGLLAQANAFARGKRADVQLLEIQGLVPRLEMDLWKLPSDITFLMGRMGSFQSAQPPPPGVQVQGPIERH